MENLFLYPIEDIENNKLMLQWMRRARKHEGMNKGKVRVIFVPDFNDVYKKRYKKIQLEGI